MFRSTVRLARLTVRVRTPKNTRTDRPTSRTRVQDTNNILNFTDNSLGLYITQVALSTKHDERSDHAAMGIAHKLWGQFTVY